MLNELTLKQAQAGLIKGKFSVTELVSDCLKAIRAKDDAIHAYLDVYEDVLADAQKADREISKYRNGGSGLPPLFGIPMAIKDNILIDGKRCSAGSKMLENYQASYDATVIKKLKEQGALFLGKTNLDEFAMGSSTENSYFGPTKNPHDTSRVPGGSSGGSAAAVSSHLCLAALGSDTGGSIRQPASFCGIVGFKPTYGSVSRHGLIAMASSLDQIGPMAKTVEDAEILFDAISGEDVFDATSNEKFGIRSSKFEIPEDSLKNLRVGIPKEYFGRGLNSEIKNVVESSIKKLEEAGAEVKEITLPHSEYALPAYYIIVPSEISANLARFDGIRYGTSAATSYQLPVTSLYDVYAKTRAEGLGAEAKRRIMLGTYALSAGYYDAYYLKAQKVRRLVRQDFERAFEEVDVVAGPTAPVPPFKLGEKISDPLEMYLSDIYTVGVNLAGLPAISLPAGSMRADGKDLPIGLQLVGRWFEDKKLLGIAKETEKVLTPAK